MFTEHMRAAIAGAPRERLAELAGAVWRAYAAGAVGESDAQALAEAVEARRAVQATKVAPRRAGSRPRSPESLERRRRWVASGWLPPQLACRFTMAEGAVLAVIAAEVAKGRGCRLTVGHLAALAGCGKTTVRTAIRQAQGLGLLVSEEWRITCWRSAPNEVRIVSPEWLSWLRMAVRRPSWRGGSRLAKATIYPLDEYKHVEPCKRSGGERTARIGPHPGTPLTPDQPQPCVAAPR